ncbi:MAG TPA: CARDB domain-containing protein [Thermoanaerobaculia bacterium]|jgi:hypothetical protein|nr:CARDB domain-containing protein [Thermoanaerobaculia bacterium]
MFKRLVLIFCFVLASFVARAEVLPDLTILEVKGEKPGEIWVRIKNIGQAPSAPSSFSVFIQFASPLQARFTSPHPGLAPGEEKWVLIKSKTKFPLSKAKYNIRVNGNGNGKVKESDFSNNGKMGNFSEKP